MAQPLSSSAQDPKLKPRTSSRVSSALKSGVVYGSSAVLTAVNNITPHIAGAVDILVIEQPDGTRKATPFYVRFGKYTALRTGERNVKLYINDELAPFGMHIGMYGQAYFASETVEVAAADDDDQEALLADMMSPPSGYSSGGEDSTPAGGGRAETAETLKAVRQRIDGLKEARGKGAARTSRGGAAGSHAPGGPAGAAGLRTAREPFPALGRADAASDASAVAGSSGTGPNGGNGVSAFDGPAHQQPQSPAPAPQLAPALSMADRNESFLSARETLATPLPDDLASVPSALFMSFTTLPSVTSGRLAALQLGQPPPQHQPSLKQAGAGASLQEAGTGAGAGGGGDAGGGGAAAAAVGGGDGAGSLDSLGPVSEGGSPCGWSDEEGERGGASPAGSCQAEVPLGQLPCRSYDAGDSPGAPPPPPATDAAAAHPHPPHQQQQQQASPPAMGSLQRQPQQHHGPQQPLHLQLGFPDNPEAPSQQHHAPDLKLLGPVDRKQVSAFGSAVDLAAGSPWTGGTEAGPAPAAVPVAAAPAGVALLPPRSRALDTPGIGRHRASPRASPGCSTDGLAAAAAAADGATHGSGSHHAVSLLSTSLRGGGSASAVAETLTEATGPGPAEHVPSIAWLKARAATIPAGTLPALEQQTAAAALGTGFVPGPTLLDGAMTAAGGDCDALGPIAAAAVVVTEASPEAVQPMQVPMQPCQRTVRASLSVTADDAVRLRLAVLPPATSAVPVSLPVGAAAAAAGMAASPPGAPPLDLPSCNIDSGYLGDAEPTHGSAVARHHHHHPHNHLHGHHYHHYGHGHGHSHSQHNDHLHSTSAPLPSSGIEAAAAAGAAATGVGSATGPSEAAVARSAHGLELSLCGSLLTAQTPYPEVAVLFDTHRVSEEAFVTRGSALLASPDLVVRFANGAIYHWQSLSYSLVGLLAFGSWRLAPETRCWTPAAGGSETDGAAVAAAAAALLAAAAQGTGAATGEVPRGGSAGGGGAASASANTTPKKGAAVATSSSWRIWMFGARRENGRTSATGGGTVATTTTTTATATAVTIGASGSVATGRSPPAPTSPLAERAGSIEHLHMSGGRTQQQTQPQQPQLAQGSAAGQQLPPGAAPAGADGQGGDGRAASGGHPRQGYNMVTKKSLTPAPDQLAALPLKRGQNTIVYKIGGSELKAYVYYLPWRTKIVISDIDGTITKSDVLGHLLPAMGLDWSHPGIAKLLTNIRHNNYLVMYLSSRSISQANITRDFINTLVQGEHRMPLGPVIISPHGLLPSLYREMILRRPHEFKIATLQDIRALFPPFWNPFYGGFGNRDTDEISYREVGVQPSRIFIINPRGELRQPIDLPKGAAAAASKDGTAAAAGGSGDASLRTSEDADGAAADPTTDGATPAQTGAAPGSSASGPPAGTAAAGGGTNADTSAAVNGAASIGHDSSFGRGTTTSTSTSSGVTAAASAAAAAPRSRTSSGAVALSSLSAINDLVDDIFPPLHDGEPLPRGGEPLTSYDEAEEEEAEVGTAAAAGDARSSSTTDSGGGDDGANVAAQGAGGGDGDGGSRRRRRRTSSGSGSGNDCVGEGRGRSDSASGSASRSRGDRESVDGVEPDGGAAPPPLPPTTTVTAQGGSGEAGAAADPASATPVGTPRSPCSPREGSAAVAASEPPPPPGASSTAVAAMPVVGGSQLGTIVAGAVDTPAATTVVRFEASEQSIPGPIAGSEVGTLSGGTVAALPLGEGTPA